MNYYTSFGYRPIEFGTELGSIRDLTQQAIIWNNLRGDQVRIRFSNRYGTEPIRIRKAMIGVLDGASISMLSLPEVNHDSSMLQSYSLSGLQPVTVDGKEEIDIAQGEEFYSDEIALCVAPGNLLIVNFFFAEEQAPSCACQTWSGKSFTTLYADGDATDRLLTDGRVSRDVFPYVAADVNRCDVLIGMCGVQVVSKEPVREIALFGDSITHMSYYADALTRILYEKYPGKVSVINRGIGGNRVLRDASYAPEIPGHGTCFGEAAVSRIEQDVFTTEVPSDVVILEGVNDLMHPPLFQRMEELPTADELAGGLQQLVDVCLSHGSKVYVGTILPYAMPEQWGELKEEPIRVEVNRKIRAMAGKVTVVDFDQAMHDEAQPERMKAGTHIGDGLHPNTEGGEIMAQTLVPLL